ncbi:hypothetical protein ABXI76_12580 [Streptomyces parvus]
MSSVSWEETERRARARRIAASLPVRTAEGTGPEQRDGVREEGGS